jgi:hypothetical protein
MVKTVATDGPSLLKSNAPKHTATFVAKKPKTTKADVSESGYQTVDMLAKNV